MKLVLVLCALVSLALCDNAGFKISVSPTGLNYAVQEAAKVIEQKLSTLKIPDISGEDDVPVLGKISYTVKNIALGSIALGAPSIAATGNVQVAIPGISIHFSGAWSYRENSWPHVSDHGTLDIDVSNSAVGIVATVGVSSAGEPTCQAQTVGVNLNDFNIDIHGGTGWLYNLLIKIFNGNVKDTVSSQIQAEITSLINNDLNQLLQTLPLKQQISNLGILDLSLVSNPILNGYICHPGKGLFSSPSVPSPPFGPSVALPDETNAAYMAQFFLSDFVGNSFFYSMYKTGKLNYDLNPNNLPSGFPKFNTNSFEFLIPSLYFKYPGYNMSATCTPQQSPVLKITQEKKRNGMQSPAAFGILATYLVDVFVVAQNGTYIPVFVLEVAVTASCDVSNAGTTLKAQITTAAVAISVSSSNIGNFTTGALQVIVNTAISSVVIPEINNSTLGNGFQIPVIDGVQLVNPTIGSANGYLAISTNIVYTPSSKKGKSHSSVVGIFD